jgi:hypothetical protein
VRAIRIAITIVVIVAAVMAAPILTLADVLILIHVGAHTVIVTTITLVKMMTN